MAGFYGSLVSQSFMRSLEVVFNQPFCHSFAENIKVGMKIAQSDKLLSQSAIKPFIVGIVFGRPSSIV